MPKNLKGGKQFKRKAKESDVDLTAFTINRQEGQQVARAIKLLGNRNILCYCNDNKIRVCHICGKMRGRVFVEVGDIVLISLRDFQLGSTKESKDLTGDILAKYPYECLTNLKKENGVNSKLFLQLEVLDSGRLAIMGASNDVNTIEDNGFEFDRDENKDDGEDKNDDDDSEDDEDSDDVDVDDI